jgi:hypothetical protein
MRERCAVVGAESFSQELEAEVGAVLQSDVREETPVAVVLLETVGLERHTPPSDELLGPARGGSSAWHLGGATLSAVQALPNTLLVRMALRTVDAEKPDPNRRGGSRCDLERIAVDDADDFGCHARSRVSDMARGQEEKEQE